MIGKNNILSAAIAQMTAHPTTLFIMIISVIGLCYLFRKKKSSPSNPRAQETIRGRREKASSLANTIQIKAAKQFSDPVKRLQNMLFLESTICIEWEVLCKTDNSHSFEEDGQKLISWLAATSNVFVLCKINTKEQKRYILSKLQEVKNLERHKILFCQTDIGYEAMARQVSPSLLITTHSANLAFLSKVFPYIIYVGTNRLEAANVSVIHSLSDFVTQITCNNM